MNEKFQQAVVASRAGQIKEAQFLLAQSLKEEPDNADAWLLLSQLVDSKEKQQAYLEKALALNPDHELANEYRVELAAESAAGTDVETAVPAPVVPAPITPESDEMAELAAILDVDTDDPLLGLEEADTQDWLAAAVATDSITADEDVESVDVVESIDFAELMEETDEETAVPDTPAKEEKAEVVVEKKKETAVVDSRKAARQKKAAQLNYIIYGLIVIAVLIVLYMAYLFIV